MDEHVPPAVMEGLVRRGVDAVAAQEAGMLGADDERHLAFASGEGRVVFTQDADFLRLQAAGHAHSGIVYAPQQTLVSAVLRGLMLVYDVLSLEDMTGQPLPGQLHRCVNGRRALTHRPQGKVLFQQTATGPRSSPP